VISIWFEVGFVSALPLAAVSLSGGLADGLDQGEGDKMASSLL
jgi:hypothetical protein